MSFWSSEWSRSACQTGVQKNLWWTCSVLSRIRLCFFCLLWKGPIFEPQKSCIINGLTTLWTYTQQSSRAAGVYRCLLSVALTLLPDYEAIILRITGGRGPDLSGGCIVRFSHLNIRYCCTPISIHQVQQFSSKIKKYYGVKTLQYLRERLELEKLAHRVASLKLRNTINTMIIMQSQVSKHTFAPTYWHRQRRTRYQVSKQRIIYKRWRCV